MKPYLLMLITGLTILSGCGDSGRRSEFGKETEQAVESALNHQKIIYIMSKSSYEEPYAAGYFIDHTGKKHIYEWYDREPFASIEQEYDYLLEHYDEFETQDFWDDVLLRKSIGYLSQVNSDSEIRAEGEVIFDAPEIVLYGVRMVGDQEEFVWLGSEPGISKRLDDAYADLIFEGFGSKWYLVK